MAVTHRGSGIIEFTAAGDQVTEALFVKSIRWLSQSAVNGDTLSIVDPSNTSNELWADFAAGPFHQADWRQLNPPWYFLNGLRIETLTGDRGTVTIEYA